MASSARITSCRSLSPSYGRIVAPLVNSVKGTSCCFEANVLDHRASVGGDRRASIAPWARVGRRLNEMPQNSYEASQAASGPYVPFDELKSDDAQSRLSRCRPVSGFRPSHVEDNKIMFAHNTGEVNFRRRQPLQLASTLGFVLNQRSGTAGREEFGGGVRVFYRFVRYRPPRVRPAGGGWGGVLLRISAGSSSGSRLAKKGPCTSALPGYPREPPF